jgi:hypothetical protein
MAAGERAPARRRRLQASNAVVGALCLSISGLAMFGTLSGLFLPKYLLSNYTQHHGVLDSGTISNVSNSWSGKSWSAAVQITLDRPVNGATSTTVTVGNAVSSPDGTPVSVLVDPQDPAYAEYPGRPAYPLLLVSLYFLCPAGVCALLFIFAVWRLAVLRYKNRGIPPPAPGRHRYPHGTRTRSRVGGLPEIASAADTTPAKRLRTQDTSACFGRPLPVVSVATAGRRR